MEFEKELHRKRIFTRLTTCFCPTTAYSCSFLHPSLPSSLPRPPSLPPSLRVIFRLHDLVKVTKVRLHRLLPVGGVRYGTRCKERKREKEEWRHEKGLRVGKWKKKKEDDKVVSSWLTSRRRHQRGQEQGHRHHRGKQKQGHASSRP